MALIFRTDLECSRQDKQGMIFYHVRDPQSGANFDLYEIEYLMALKLDGVREVDEVVADIYDDYDFEISLEDFETFMAQLSTLGFVRDLAEDGEGLDAAATQVFRTPVDNTKTQQFKISETAALIDAGDTSHLAPKKMMPPRKLAMTIGVGALALLLSTVGAFFLLGGSETGVRATAVKATRVALYFEQPAIEVRSQRETWLSFAQGGKVAELSVEPKVMVKTGQVLAALTLSGAVKKQISRAQEQVNKKAELFTKASAQVDAIYAERAKIEKKRAAADAALEKLEPGNVGKGKISRKEARKWRNKRASANKKLGKLVKKERKLVQKQTRARLALDKAKAQLETRELKVADKTLSAPFDGQVVSVGEVETGSRVEADQQIIHVRDPAKLEITFQVPKFKSSKQGGQGFIVVEGQASQAVTITNVGGKQGARLVSVQFDDPSKEIIYVSADQFRLVREFREPAYRLARAALVNREGKTMIAIMREGRVLWVPVEVLWKDKLMVAVALKDGIDLTAADMVLLGTLDGSALGELDDDDRVVMSN
ncbi:MAG: HlyD family efflux transporter periplasmic adaptor subunit [Deltaproteobacteria bacterium]|nr:HlyD family efflux transporter periplasmic adaptor subunit [Deltaproteobacteria bacterium]MBT6489602.1 HlyD family efflux transporter periplasmic adaptor subunit [Deltaproteobacteria bacterium]